VTELITDIIDRNWSAAAKQHSAHQLAALPSRLARVDIPTVMISATEELARLLGLPFKIESNSASFRDWLARRDAAPDAAAKKIVEDVVAQTDSQARRTASEVSAAFGERIADKYAELTAATAPPPPAAAAPPPRAHAGQPLGSVTARCVVHQADSVLNKTTFDAVVSADVDWIMLSLRFAGETTIYDTYHKTLATSELYRTVCARNLRARLPDTAFWHSKDDRWLAILFTIIFFSLATDTNRSLWPSQCGFVGVTKRLCS